MKRIVITIDLEHAAMEENPQFEISEILKTLGDLTEFRGIDYLDDLALIDSNGNTVGKSVIKNVRETS